MIPSPAPLDVYGIEARGQTFPERNLAALDKFSSAAYPHAQKKKRRLSTGTDRTSAVVQWPFCMIDPSDFAKPVVGLWIALSMSVLAHEQKLSKNICTRTIRTRYESRNR